MGRLADLFVSIRGDDSQLNKDAARVRATLTKIDKTKVSPKLEFENVTPEIRSLSNKLKQVEREKIRLGLDSTTAAADVATLRRQLEGLQRKRHEVPVELGGQADEQITQVAAQLRAAEKKQTTLPLKLERVEGRLAAVRGELTKLAKPVEVPVDVGGRSFRQRVADVRQNMLHVLAGPETEQGGQRAGKKITDGIRSSVLPGMKSLAVAAVGALAAGGIATLVSESVQKASDLNETVAKSTNVFGKQSQVVSVWAKTSARSFGLSRAEALAATSQFGDMFSQLGFTGDQAATTSQQVVKLAADLGSFHNIDPSDVLERISAGFRGEYDSLQLLIPNISAARVEQEALTLSHKNSTRALTAAEKATAVLSIIQKDGANAADDFAETSTGLANAQRIVAAQTEDLKAKLGGRLVPVLAEATTKVSQFLDEMDTGQGVGGRFAASLETGYEVGKRMVEVATDLYRTLRPVGEFLGGTFFGSADRATGTVSTLIAILGARKAAGAAAAFSETLGGIATRMSEVDGRAGRLSGRVQGVSGMLARSAGVLGGPWGLAIGAGVGLLVAFATKQSEAAKEAKAFTDTLTFQNGVLDENSRLQVADKIAKDGTLAAALKAGVSEKAYTDALLAGGPARQAMIKQLEETARAHTSTSLSGTATSRVTDAVGNSALKAAETLKTMGVELDGSATSSTQAKNALTGTATATGFAADKARQLAEDTRLLKENQGELTKAQATLRTVTQQVIDKFTILREGSLDTGRANDAFRDSLDSVKEAVRENGRALASNTAKGRANREAIRDSISALNDKVTADFKHTESEKGVDAALRQATASTKSGRKAILDAADAAGVSRKAAARMIDQYLKTPKELKTDVKTPGLKTATEGVKNFRDKVADLKDKTLDVTVKYGKTGSVSLRDDKGNRINSANGPGRGMADGGAPVLPGYTPGRDIHTFVSKTAGKLRLSGGEGIMRPELVRQIGGARGLAAANLKARRGQRAFANGGVIGERHLELNVTANQPPNVARAYADAVNEAMKIAKTSARAVAVASAKAEVKRQRKALEKAAANGPKAGDVTNPAGRGSFRGKTFTNLFIANLKAVERSAGSRFDIYQGGFRPTTSYSGSTHNKDAIDAKVNSGLLRAFRRIAGAMGDRTGLGNWASHMHGVPAPGHGYGSKTARQQYSDYKRRGGASQSARSRWGLADGALIRGGRGGVDVTIGESPRDELVLPLPKGWNEAVRSTEQTSTGRGGAPLIGSVTWNVQDAHDGMQELAWGLRRLDLGGAHAGR